MRNLEDLSCTIGPRAGGQSVSKAVSIPSVVHSAFDARDEISQAFPLRICIL